MEERQPPRNRHNQAGAVQRRRVADRNVVDGKKIQFNFLPSEFSHLSRDFFS